MAPRKSNNLVATLKALQDTPEEAIVAAGMREERQMISAAVPSPTLINRYRPNFINGYNIDTASVMDAVKKGLNVLAVGDKGGGKSSFMFFIVDELNEPTRVKNREIYARNVKLIEAGKDESALEQYYSLPYPVAHLGCGSSTRVESLIGTLKFRATENGREPYTVYGAVVDAWVNGKILIIDELDMATPDVWGEVHQFFDGTTEETVLYINGPEVIRKNPKFRVLATANTFGLGEDQMGFAGTQLLNGALLDRFNYKLSFPYLNPDKEVEALLKNHPDAWKEAVIKMVVSANKIREAKNSGTITETLSTRKLMAWVSECISREKRLAASGINARSSIDGYWAKVVIPAAQPTYLCGNPDALTVQTYLELR